MSMDSRVLAEEDEVHRRRRQSQFRHGLHPRVCAVDCQARRLVAALMSLEEGTRSRGWFHAAPARDLQANSNQRHVGRYSPGQSKATTVYAAWGSSMP